jgi:ketosteroid isomerase-like protein
MERLIRDLYASFNARDIEAVLAHLDPDVDWPNAWEGGRVRGRAKVRDYWTRQFAVIDSHVEPEGFSTDPEGRIVVDVHQVVRDLDGKLLSDGHVQHLYTLRDGLVERMDVSEGG